MDDLQWIRDVKVNPWDGIEFKVSAHMDLKTTYKILDWGDPKGVRVVWRDNDDYGNEWKHAHYTREEVENYVNKGNWVIVNENMTESEDDLQWIRDIEPNPRKPEKGFIYKFYNYSNSIHGEYIKTDDIIITHVTGDHVYFDTVNRYWANHPMDPGSDGIDKKAFNRLINAGDIKYIGPKNINESEDLQWIMDVKSYPTLQQLFDKGEIKEGDVLVLRGEVQEDDDDGEMTWVNDFTVTINSKGERLNTTGFDLDPNKIDVKKAMGLSDPIHTLTFLKSDGNLEVIRKNNKSTQLTESDDFDWIRDITHQLPKDRDWWLINDVDQNSLEVSREIQDFLFNQGFNWISGRRKFLPNKFSAISHRGGTYGQQSGTFSYYPTSEYTTKEIERYEAENGEIYYWSQLKSDSLNP